MTKLRIEAQVSNLQDMLLKLTEFLEDWKTNCPYPLRAMPSRRGVFDSVLFPSGVYLGGLIVLQVPSVF
jgi:hypothetical protein